MALWVRKWMLSYLGLFLEIPKFPGAQVEVEKLEIGRSPKLAQTTHIIPKEICLGLVAQSLPCSCAAGPRRDSPA